MGQPGSYIIHLLRKVRVSSKIRYYNMIFCFLPQNYLTACNNTVQKDDNIG
jgi:hypothetical protein